VQEIFDDDLCHLGIELCHLSIDIFRSHLVLSVAV
jgi:hypothetical protein